MVHTFGHERGPLSSTSGLLHGLRWPGSKYPGHRVIKSVHKDEQSDRRTVVFYGGERMGTTKKKLSELARDRGFDRHHQRFMMANPQEKATMLERSVQWQGRAKKRWLGRLAEEIPMAKGKARRDLKIARGRLRAAPVRSPHSGHKPQSAYLQRYWA